MVRVGGLGGTARGPPVPRSEKKISYRNRRHLALLELYYYNNKSGILAKKGAKKGTLFTYLLNYCFLLKAWAARGWLARLAIRLGFACLFDFTLLACFKHIEHVIPAF